MTESNAKVQERQQSQWAAMQKAEILSISNGFKISHEYTTIFYYFQSETIGTLNECKLGYTEWILFVMLCILSAGGIELPNQEIKFYLFRTIYSGEIDVQCFSLVMNFLILLMYLYMPF